MCVWRGSCFLSPSFELTTFNWTARGARRESSTRCARIQLRLQGGRRKRVRSSIERRAVSLSRKEVGYLLEALRLARLYAYVLRSEDVTIDDIAADLEMPRSTAYVDTSTPVDLGVLTRDESTKAHTYRATALVLTVNLDGDQYTTTPTFIEAFGRTPHDRDLDVLIERYGLGELAAAHTYAVLHATGDMTERVAARELNLLSTLAIAVLQPLRDLVVEMESHDPLFEEIRNARDGPIEEA